MAIATSTSELWHALRGLLCLHKPSGAVLKDVIKGQLISECLFDF